MIGNIINIIISLNERRIHSQRIDLSTLDFFHFPVKQAYLQGQYLHNLDFSYSDLRESVFSQTFGNIQTVACSSKDMLAIGDSDGRIFILDSFKDQQFRFLGSHQDWIVSLDFNHQGDRLISGSSEGCVKIWDISSEPCAACEPIIGSSRLWAVAFSYSGNRFAYACMNNIYVFEFSGNCFNQILELTGHTNEVRTIAFNPNDDDVIVSGSSDHTIRIWDLTTGSNHVLEGHSQGIISIDFSYDGRWIASGSIDHTIKIWEVDRLLESNARPGSRTLTSCEGEVKSVVFSPVDYHLASASGRTVQVHW